MKCPYCSRDEDRVLDTRVHKEGEQLRRRRQCNHCKGRFTTVESWLPTFPLVIKKDKRKEDFNKQKLLNGIQSACQKRPVSQSTIEHIVDRVSKWILDRFEKEVSSIEIGQRVMEELRVLDDVAYVRFAAVYKSFKDLENFVETLQDEEKKIEKKLTEEFQMSFPPSK